MAASNTASPGSSRCPSPNVSSKNRHPDRSEAEWRDLLIVQRMNRSLHFASLRSASVGMTEEHDA
jgi:hypothetical protein